MPVEYTVDSLDTVDESIRGAYVENEGKFNFDADKYAEIKAQGLKSKNSELIKKLNLSKEAAKRFEKFAELEDDDLAELLELREQKLNPPPPDPNKGKDSELQAQFDKALKTKEAKWNSEKAAIEAERDELRKENKHFKLTVPLRDAALKAGVLADDLELVMLDTAKRFALNDDSNIVVLDEDGDPTDITPAKFFETLYREQRPKFYAASGASGSGAPSATGSNAGKRVMRRAEYDKFQLSNPQGAASFMKDVLAGKASLVD